MGVYCWTKEGTFKNSDFLAFMYRMYCMPVLQDDYMDVVG